jgi:hypothetical protein
MTVDALVLERSVPSKDDASEDGQKRQRQPIMKKRE